MRNRSKVVSSMVSAPAARLIGRQLQSIDIAIVRETHVLLAVNGTDEIVSECVDYPQPPRTR